LYFRIVLLVCYFRIVPTVWYFRIVPTVVFFVFHFIYEISNLNQCGNPGFKIIIFN
jgi:hypothetical protein